MYPYEKRRGEILDIPFAQVAVEKVKHGDGACRGPDSGNRDGQNMADVRWESYISLLF